MQQPAILHRRRPLLRYLLASVLLLLATGCADTVKKAEHSLHGHTMGTRYNISFVNSTKEQSQTVYQQTLQAGVDNLLQQINQSMSTYIADSELNRFNNLAVNQWMPISADLFTVIRQAQNISLLSTGAFDITVGPLVDLWGFGPGFSAEQVPAKKQITALKQRTGYHEIELDSTQQRIRKTSERRLDLSAIAKGFATDKVADYLQQQGIKHYLVEIGGEIRLKGHKPDGSLWRVAIEKPVSDERAVMKLLSLTNVAIATSGDYRNFFEANGKRYSHTIDPNSGYPIRHQLVSVTVITDRCIKADAFATAMMVMGVKNALALAKQEKLAVLLIKRTKKGFVEYKNAAFSAYLKEQ
ncbi:MAG: FAD:protein FMN transferase [Gammaproteobacteria bacterium]|nr:FAD:protein FMN transferase [Gammaproteobacteria bacterium]